jgi:hypothetical protein
MKKSILLGTLIISSLFSFSATAGATDLSKLKVVASNSINSDCGQSNDYDPVWGCFENKYISQGANLPMKIVPTIYIRSNIPSALLPYTFLQNFGQYLISGYSDQELEKVFNPVPSAKETLGIRRSVANSFVMWFYGGHVSVDQADFFKSALTK